MKDFAISFQYREGVPFDMLDNDYIRLRFRHVIKVSEDREESTEIGLKPCDDTVYLKDLYSKGDIKRDYGQIYCFEGLTDQMMLKGSSLTGKYP